MDLSETTERRTRYGAYEKQRLPFLETFAAVIRYNFERGHLAEGITTELQDLDYEYIHRQLDSSTGVEGLGNVLDIGTRAIYAEMRRKLIEAYHAYLELSAQGEIPTSVGKDPWTQFNVTSKNQKVRQKIGFIGDLQKLVAVFEEWKRFDASVGVTATGAAPAATPAPSPAQPQRKVSTPAPTQSPTKAPTETALVRNVRTADATSKKRQSIESLEPSKRRHHVETYTTDDDLLLNRLHHVVDSLTKLSLPLEDLAKLLGPFSSFSKTELVQRLYPYLPMREVLMMHIQLMLKEAQSGQVTGKNTASRKTKKLQGPKVTKKTDAVPQTPKAKTTAAHQTTPRAKNATPKAAPKDTPKATTKATPKAATKDTRRTSSKATPVRAEPLEASLSELSDLDTQTPSPENEGRGTSVQQSDDDYASEADNEETFSFGVEVINVSTDEDDD